jgi:hypothetical protein
LQSGFMVAESSAKKRPGLGDNLGILFEHKRLGAELVQYCETDPPSLRIFVQSHVNRPFCSTPRVGRHLRFGLVRLTSICSQEGSHHKNKNYKRRQWCEGGNDLPPLGGHRMDDDVGAAAGASYVHVTSLGGAPLTCLPRRLFRLGIDGQPGPRTTPRATASMGFSGRRNGRRHK